MITIRLADAGKRFNREWIFRRLSYVFAQGQSYAIIGANGSGKSTLLQVIAGAMNPSEGQCTYTHNEQSIDGELIYQHAAIAAPYLELIEEMTAKEFLHFHQQFKPFQAGFSTDAILNTIGMQHAADKQIRYYSSGMKQRIKLAQAIFADTPVLLLDEPCTNLDQQGYALYHQLIRDYCSKKLIIVCSNDVQEYDFCTHQLNIMQYKQA
jgi:ABC-type multidrug transport system ATPase subunit